MGTTVALLLAALVADLTLAGLGLRGALSESETQLEKLQDRLAAGNLPAARSLSTKAAHAAASAEAAMARPSIFLASLVPEVTEEIEAMEAAVTAATLTAQAARSVVDGASALGLDEEGIPRSLYVNGQVQLDTLTRARQELNTAELLLVEAVVALEGLQPRLEQLKAPLTEAHNKASAALDRATRARTLFDLLPSLLGGDGKRSYLLAFQAPGEARGTGGLIGLIGTLQAEAGRLEMGRVRPYQEIFSPFKNAVEAPRWFEDSYAVQAALTEWPQANVSPNFPIVSEVLLAMYEKATGESLDGVISMDPIALAHLMEGTGPVETEHPPETVDASNVADVLLVDSYTEFASPKKQNTFLREVVDGFWSKVAGGDLDLEAFSKGLGEAIRTQHVKIFSAAPTDQEHIDALGLDGNYDLAGPNAQMAFNVNYGANKVDYFLHREVDTDVHLQSDGTAEVTTTLQLHSRAPAGPPSVLLGPGGTLEPGTNRMTINLLMPPGSQVQSFSLDGKERAPFTYVDDESPVLWDVLQLDPGSQQTVTVTYSIPGAIQILGENTVFDFVLFPQTTVNADTYRLTVEPPPGSRPVEGPNVTSEGTLEMSGTLDEPVVVRLEMEGQ